MRTKLAEASKREQKLEEALEKIQKDIRTKLMCHQAENHMQLFLIGLADYARSALAGTTPEATVEFDPDKTIDQELCKKEDKPLYITCPLCGGDGFLIMESFLDETQVICHRCRGRKEIPNPELNHGK